MLRFRNGFNKRITAYVLAFFVVFFALCTSLFMAVEAGHHDCHDEHCSVCTIIHQCENSLRQQAGDVNDSVFILLPAVLFAVSFIFSENNLIFETPISKKVRLND